MVEMPRFKNEDFHFGCILLTVGVEYCVTCQ